MPPPPGPFRPCPPRAAHRLAPFRIPRTSCASRASPRWWPIRRARACWRSCCRASTPSAGELARTASVGAATASAHLVKLVDAGLLVCEPRGRHRYFRIAGRRRRPRARGAGDGRGAARRTTARGGRHRRGCGCAMGALLLRDTRRAPRRRAARPAARAPNGWKTRLTGWADRCRRRRPGAVSASMRRRGGGSVHRTASPIRAWTGRSDATTSPASSPAACCRTSSRAAGCAASAASAPEPTPPGQQALAPLVALD